MHSGEVAPDTDVWGNIPPGDRVPRTTLDSLTDQDRIRIRVLASLEMDDESPCAAIARRIGSARETVEKACQFLQALGWVVIKHLQGDDSRRKYARLTLKGKEALDHLWITVERPTDIASRRRELIASQIALASHARSTTKSK